MTTGTLNPRLQEIAEEFGAALPPLPGRYAGHRDLLERVPECQTPLFLAVEVDGGGTVHLFFDAPPESPTTRGFAGILHAGLDGLNADEVLATPGEFSSRLWAASRCARAPTSCYMAGDGRTPTLIMRLRS